MQTVMREELQSLVKTPLSKARWLPPAVYCSQEIYQHEMKNIFEREWVCVGRAEEVQNPGDYLAVDVVGEPLLVARGKDNELRAFSNVCRHKWMILAQGTGNTRSFVCPYHGWTYGLDGKFRGARYMEGSEAHNPAECNLPTFRCATWGGFVFVTLNSELDDVGAGLKALDEIIGPYEMGRMKRFTGDDEVWHTNWKLLAENFTESYHTFITHRDTLEDRCPTALTKSGFATDRFTMFYAPMKGGDAPSEPCSPRLTDEQKATVVMVCLYPSLVIALGPERVFYMCLLPKSPGSVLTRWGVCTYGEKLSEEKLKQVAAFYRLINEEDRTKLEEMQRGVSSRMAGRGPLSWLEQSNGEFEKYIASRLSAA